VIFGEVWPCPGWSQDKGCPRDPDEAAGVEAAPAQGLEGDLEQGVRALGDTMDATDHPDERPLLGGEFAVLWLLDRVAEPGPGALVAQVGQGGYAQGGCELVESGEQAVRSGAGGVVHAAPVRPA
jgi:hypothetical protein